MIRVALLSSKAVLRSGLRALLEEFFPAGAEDQDVIRVVFEARGLEDLDNFPEDIDLMLVTDDVLEAIRLDQMKTALVNGPPLIMLFDNPQLPQEVFQAPWFIRGALPLESSPEELIAGCRAVSEGLVVLSPAVLASFRPAIPEPLHGLQGSFLLGQALIDEPYPVESLTAREREVLQWIAQGLANKQVAAVLKISEHTVKFHISSIYTKLGVTNRAEAVRRGIQLGLILL